MGKGQKVEGAYRNLRRLKNILRHMTRAQRLSNRLFHSSDQLQAKRNPRLHQQEEHHRFVRVVGTALAHTDRVGDFLRELRVNHIIDLAGAEADAGWVEDAIGAAEEEDLFGYWVDADEVAVGPDVCFGI